MKRSNSSSTCVSCYSICIPFPWELCQKSLLCFANKPKYSNSTGRFVLLFKTRSTFPSFCYRPLHSQIPKSQVTVATISMQLAYLLILDSCLEKHRASSIEYSTVVKVALHPDMVGLIKTIKDRISPVRVCVPVSVYMGKRFIFKGIGWHFCGNTLINVYCNFGACCFPNLPVFMPS